MDGVSEIDDYCKLAKAMGHKAIAITDHGVVQGFPAAQQAAKKHGIKMLYGAELYVVEDEFTAVLNPNDEKLADATYCVLDFESTGLSTRYDKIIEFGAVKLKNGIILDRIDMLINPGEKLPRKIVEITGITDAMLRNQPTIDEAIDRIMEFIGDSVIVSHNLEFDFGLLNTALQQTRGVELVNAGVDTLSLSIAIVANILCTFCYKEQWILWFILDVVQTILYFVIGQPLMAIMYIAWAINTIYGYICWSKESK